MAKIMAIGAHSDDYEYGCGASLVRHASKGDEVIGLILSDGKRGGHKREEAFRAAEILGLRELHFGEFPEGNIPQSSDVLDFLRKYITHDVKRVYGPVKEDANPDHINTAIMVARFAELRVPEILLYEGPRNKGFCPNYFIEITKDELDRKIKAYASYETQQKRGSLFSDIEPMAKFRGGRAKLKSGLAEAFEVYNLIRAENEM